MIDYPLPLVGFCAFSGTGKTTLLTRLLPLLKLRGLRVGVVKHAHHLFDIDYPGKDSYELRLAGASQMLVASRKRMAWVKESQENRPEPVLEEALLALETEHLDLVLIEGFKQAAIPKIELHRPALGKPLMYPAMPNIIAIATDAPLADKNINLPLLSLNQPVEIAEFIIETILQPHNATKLLPIEKEASHVN
ncbi:MAG: molybdopterin-guanine dinucleotide biosynthesis protein B [Halobacteria archaeon]|nr:molybdopterin-guanine dinucleotide biosynthesis protein B [Halobacteria archaeon]